MPALEDQTNACFLLWWHFPFAMYVFITVYASKIMFSFKLQQTILSGYIFKKGIGHHLWLIVDSFSCLFNKPANKFEFGIWI